MGLTVQSFYHHFQPLMLLLECSINQLFTLEYNES